MYLDSGTRDTVAIPRANPMIVCIYAMYKTIHL